MSPRRPRTFLTVQCSCGVVQKLYPLRPGRDGPTCYGDFEAWHRATAFVEEMTVYLDRQWMDWIKATTDYDREWWDTNVGPGWRDDAERIAQTLRERMKA